MIEPRASGPGGPVLLQPPGVQQPDDTLQSRSEACLMCANGLTLNWGWCTLSYDGRSVRLSPGEMRLAAVLMSAAPSRVSRITIAGRLWSETSAPTDQYKAIAVWISGLRRKLIAIRCPAVIESIRGAGYRMTV
jgi:DNA-binding response OmpR family regulator